MALIFCDGFDAYSAITDAEYKGWVVRNAGTDTFLNGTAGVYGGNAIEIDNFSNFLGVPNYFRRGFERVPGGTDCYFSFWFKTDVAGFGTDRQIFAAGSSTGYTSIFEYQVALNSLSDGTIRFYVRDGNNLLYTSSAKTADTWYWMTVRIRSANSGGQVEWWVDGVQEHVNNSVDTVDSGNPEGIDFCAFGGANAASYFFDDLIIYDGTGTGPFSSALPACRIDTLYPSGAGSASTSTATGAASNWQAVNSTNPDPATVYTRFNSTGQDLFAMDNPPTTASRGGRPVATYGVVMNGIGGLSHGGGTTQTIRPIVRSNAATGSGATITPRRTARRDDWHWTIQEVIEQDPGTVDDWDYTDLDALEAGWERVA